MRARAHATWARLFEQVGRDRTTHGEASLALVDLVGRNGQFSTYESRSVPKDRKLFFRSADAAPL